MDEREFITSLLGIQGWKAKKVSMNELPVILTIELEREPGTPSVCSKCGSAYLSVYDHYPMRKVEELPAFGHRTFLTFSQARVECRACGSIEPEKLDWVEAYQHQTLRYQRYLATLCDYMPVADVAELSGVSKDALYRIDKRFLQERHERFKNEHPVKYLGIDEISIHKGHRYATVFYDLQEGMVVGMVEERKQRKVSRFFRRWGKDKCKNVVAVCTDLWSPFHNSVKLYLNHATLVFDKFHVFKYLSEAIDNVRKDEQRKLEDEQHSFIKGIRWLILKKELNCKQKRKLKEVIEQNQNIAKAILLKESFEAFYAAESIEEAEAVLDEWLTQCNESKLKPFIKLARRLNRWKDGIIAFFIHRITNGVAEGINNKIKVIKRRSYGFKDIEYFFLKILMSTGFIPKMREVYP
jgi:transposase